MNVVRERPWLEGEDGPLERRVSTTFEEGLLSDHIEPDAMEYWFTEPEGGDAAGQEAGAFDLLELHGPHWAVQGWGLGAWGGKPGGWGLQPWA